MTKNIKSIIVFLSFIFVLGVNLLFRSYPINFPQLKETAKNIVNDRIENASYQQVQDKFPSYSGYAKEGLINYAQKEYKKQKAKEISKDIQKEYDTLKDKFQDQYGQTYLMELDCWHWARYVENAINSGRIGDRIINGKDYDTYMLAPVGQETLYNKFLFYATANLYKIFNNFFPTDLKVFLFYLPLFHITLLITILFFCCLSLYGIFSAVISCLLIGLAPIFLPRSYVGWFDMDILSILFSFVIVFIYLKAFHIENNFKRFLLTGVSAFLTSLFASTWIAWPIILGILFFYTVFSVVNEISTKYQYKIDNDELIQRHIIQIFIYIFFLWFFVYLVCELNIFSYFFSLIKPMLSLNDKINGQVWPNVLSTVGELKIPNILDIARSVGGSFVFLTGILSMIFLIFYSKTVSAIKRDSIFLWIIWFFAIYLLCFKGIRFIMFLLVPLGICLGWILDELWFLLKKREEKYLKFIPVVVFGILIVIFLYNGNRVGKSLFPIMTDNWYSVLTTLKEKTAKNSIINSWWDFGDWFKTAGDRRVIFDGQSQNSPQGYWMANVLITNSEEEAIGILRMLNNGGNKAFDIINAYFNDDFFSVMLLKKIMGKDFNESKSILNSTTLPEKIQEQVLHLLFDTPPEAYFVVDGSMLSKMPAISYLGNWNFYKLYMYKNIEKPIKEIERKFEKLSINKDFVKSLYNETVLVSDYYKDEWLSQRSRFFGGVVSGKQEKNTVLFDSGMVYYPKDNLVYNFNKRSGKYELPQNLFVWDNGNILRYPYPDSQLDFSVLLFKNYNGVYQAMQLNEEMANCMFTRLFFFEAKGLKYFEIFTKDKNSEVIVFKIKWNGKKQVLNK